MNYRWCCVEADHGTAISHQALMHLHTHSYTTRCTSTRATHGERRTQQGQRKMMCATNIPNPKWKWIHSFASASRLNAQGHHLFCFYTRRPTTRTNFMICTHINGEWLAPERVYTQFSGQLRRSHSSFSELDTSFYVYFTSSHVCLVRSHQLGLSRQRTSVSRATQIYVYMQHTINGCVVC